MYQIDWGAKSCKVPQRKALPKAKNRNLAIASFCSLQISTLAIMPMISFAETRPIQSSQEDLPEEILRAEIYTDARFKTVYSIYSITFNALSSNPNPESF